MTPSETTDSIPTLSCVDPAITNVEECEDLYLKSVYRLDTLDRACNEMRYIIKDMENMQRRLCELREQHSVMAKRINSAQIDLDKVDERQRKHNLVIFGLEETGTDQEFCGDLVRDLAESYLNVVLFNEDIVSAYRLKSNSVPRPVLVKLSSDSKKSEILKASGQLRGTGIGVREDFPYTVRQQRRVLTRKMHEERRAGRRASLDCDTLKVEGKVFVCDKYCANVVEVSKDGVRVEGIGANGSAVRALTLNAQCLGRDWLEKHSKLISEKMRILHGNSG